MLTAIEQHAANFLTAIADIISELGEVKTDDLFKSVAATIDQCTFNTVVDRLIRVGVVERCGERLVWVG